MFLVSSKPTLSARIHLCLKPLGAGGASRDDGGTHTFGLSDLDLVWFAREVFLFLSYAYASFVIFNCFAYSSSGTPNFLAIATCEEVSLTVWRPGLTLLFAEATV
jgi:hypothetical protein